MILFRQLRHLANVLRNNMTMPDIGVITVADRHAVFLSQTHFHIFALFFPLAARRIPASVSAVVDLYRAANLAVKEAATTGNDVIVTSRDRDVSYDVTTSSAQRRPAAVFEREAETLRR